MTKALSVGAALLVLAGCDNPRTKPTNENFIATLNAYFADHSDCLLEGAVTFPLETTDPEITKQMDALAAAQILEAHSEPSIHVSRYILTPAGRRAGGHLCFGHREVTAILTATPLAKQNGFMETNVAYRYKLQDIPIWAKTPELIAAFPVLAKESTGTDTGKATLAVTSAGWSVPN